MEMEFKDSGRRRTLVLLIGVLLAIGAGGAAFFLSNQGGATPATVPTRKIVVAAIPINARSTIEATQLTIRTVPEDASNANAFTDPALVVGRTAAVSIYQFQPITPNLLATSGVVGGVSILKPTETIAPDSPFWRAASVNIPPQRAAGGLAEVGQRVDLIATLIIDIPATPQPAATEGAEATPAPTATPGAYYTDRTTKIVWTDVEILAKRPDSDIYVLKVDLHQAEEIAAMQDLATENRATFFLVVRPDADNREIDRSSYGENINRLIEQYNFPISQRIDLPEYPQPSPQPTPFPNVPYLLPSPSPEASPEQ